MSDVDFLRSIVTRHPDFPKPVRLPYPLTCGLVFNFCTALHRASIFLTYSPFFAILSR